MTAPRHFLDLDRIDAPTLRSILDLAVAFKTGAPPKGDAKPLVGKTLAMIFEKPSTRTRVSFEVGMQQLGGASVTMSYEGTQLGRGEALSDTARVLSRYVDILMFRTGGPEKLDELAEFATVPVINGLTSFSHPCQVMADIMTFEEHRGPIAGRRVTWIGAGNNMATSWVHAATRFGFSLALACPASQALPAEVVEWARANGGDVALTEDPETAAIDADAVVTDAWVSMGDDSAAARRAALAPYCVDDRLMSRAKADSLFLHCLPAHRGEEVTDSVIDGPHSVVWDEAENRLHAQKGILYWCLS